MDPLSIIYGQYYGILPGTWYKLLVRVHITSSIIEVINHTIPGTVVGGGTPHSSFRFFSFFLPGELYCTVMLPYCLLFP